MVGRGVGAGCRSCSSCSHSRALGIAPIAGYPSCLVAGVVNPVLARPSGISSGWSVVFGLPALGRIAAACRSTVGGCSGADPRRRSSRGRVCVRCTSRGRGRACPMDGPCEQAALGVSPNRRRHLCESGSGQPPCTLLLVGHRFPVLPERARTAAAPGTLACDSADCTGKCHKRFAQRVSISAHTRSVCRLDASQ